jgi:hypothetical protein
VVTSPPGLMALAHPWPVSSSDSMIHPQARACFYSGVWRILAVSTSGHAASRSKSVTGVQLTGLKPTGA